MKISLISPYPDITSFGLRTISAYMREKGHGTRIVFLPDPFGDDLMFGVKRYDDAILDKLAALVRDSDIVGLTLMTNFFDGATQITAHLKKFNPDQPIIWGGVHPTIRPEESLEFADIVCIGDGEDNLLELLDRMDKGETPTDVQGLWFKRGGEIIKNQVRPLEVPLDAYPIPDYSHEDHYIMRNGDIVPMTWEMTREYLENGTVSRYLGMIGYQTMTGRGCPHKCTYCINDTIKNLYGGHGYLRWRSTEHVMRELNWVKEHMPYVEYFWISDDAFFARKVSEIEEFCKRVKNETGLKFTCLGSPLTINKEKMDILVDNGMVYLQMGIQTGSARIQEIFNRKSMSNERVMKAVRLINEYKDRLYPPSYDFILDVPYEVDRDKIDSLRLIAEFPKPYRLQPFSLVLYPETKLYKMALADGFIKDERRDIYSKSYTMHEPNFINLLIALTKNGRFPSLLLKFLVSSPVVEILNSGPLRPFFKALYLGLKRLNNIRKALKGKQ